MKSLTGFNEAMPPTPDNKREDTKGGTCLKCGIQKGGDYGMNGRGEQSYHVCNRDNFIEKTLAEFDEKYINDPNYWLGYTHVKPPTAASQNVKEFISSALNAQREKSKENNQFYYNRGYLDAREEVREQIKKMQHSDATCQGEYCEFNNTLDIILTLLSPNNKENE